MLHTLNVFFFKYLSPIYYKSLGLLLYESGSRSPGMEGGQKVPRRIGESWCTRRRRGSFSLGFRPTELARNFYESNYSKVTKNNNQYSLGNDGADLVSFDVTSFIYETS